MWYLICPFYPDVNNNKKSTPGPEEKKNSAISLFTLKELCHFCFLNTNTFCLLDRKQLTETWSPLPPFLEMRKAQTKVHMVFAQKHRHTTGKMHLKSVLCVSWKKFVKQFCFLIAPWECTRSLDQFSSGFRENAWIGPIFME